MIPDRSSLTSPQDASHAGKNPLPKLAITTGEAGGVGPELALKAASMAEVCRRCVPIVYGPVGLLRRVAERLDLPFPPNAVDVGRLDPDLVRPGHFSALTGAASFAAVERAIDDALAKRVDAIVTGPIQKEAWHEAGIRFPGHTELLAARTGTGEVRMMLTSDSIACALVTIHLPLADVPAAITIDGVESTIRMAADAVARRLRRPPRVTVCGLNPHAGENGLFSRGEEESVIAPAIARVRRDGLCVTDPVSPDTAFTPARRAETDVYICMYHDQGLIPLKALSFDEGVNVTLGLPIVRTSVDHGTALDLAWQGKADHRSMLAAIRLAIEMAG